jgi:hypothetical protein
MRYRLRSRRKSIGSLIYGRKRWLRRQGILAGRFTKPSRDTNFEVGRGGKAEEGQENNPLFCLERQTVVGEGKNVGTEGIAYESDSGHTPT